MRPRMNGQAREDKPEPNGGQRERDVSHHRENRVTYSVVLIEFVHILPLALNYVRYDTAYI